MNFLKRMARAVPMAVATTCLFLGSVSAQQSLTVGSDSTLGLSPRTLPVTMTSTAPTEGFVLAIAFDNSLVTIDDVSIAGSVTASVGAELVVSEILPNQGATLGVVLDAGAPFDAQMIPAGADQLLASITVTPITIVALATDAALTFVDGTLNSPPLDNLLVQGGQSVRASNGLGLNNGILTLLPPPPDALRIESASFPSNSQGNVRILMSNQSGPVQGYVLAITHNSAVLTLEAITLTGTVAEVAGAELVVPQVLPNGAGGTLGVVLDFQSPFGGQVIAPGALQHVANFVYSCNAEIIDPAPSTTTDLTFVDGVLSNPPLENVIVVGGQSLHPGLEHGTFTCLPIPPPPVENTEFVCGPANLPLTGDSTIEGVAGSEVEICFYYQDEDDNLQGFQIAACVDCNLTMTDFSLGTSILVDLQTEFVSFDIDNDPNDGDGCEFVAGILLDALPPFENQTAPQSAEPLLIGCLTATISPNTPCNVDLPVLFCDFINGTGNVPIENIVVIDFESIQSFEKTGCVVRVVPDDIFQRGDCNSDDKVNLADAATVLGQQFLGIQVLCADACDSNDDGSINLADSVFLLNYLFKFGPTPPAPGPVNDGSDPTSDLLPFCVSNDSNCP